MRHGFLSRWLAKHGRDDPGSVAVPLEARWTQFYCNIRNSDIQLRLGSALRFSGLNPSTSMCAYLERVMETIGAPRLSECGITRSGAQSQVPITRARQELFWGSARRILHRGRKFGKARRAGRRERHVVIATASINSPMLGGRAETWTRSCAPKSELSSRPGPRRVYFPRKRYSPQPEAQQRMQRCAPLRAISACIVSMSRSNSPRRSMGTTTRSRNRRGGSR